MTSKNEEPSISKYVADNEWMVYNLLLTQICKRRILN